MKLKNSPRFMASLLMLLLAAGCSKEPESVSSTSNPNIKAETLFTHDGCTVYRFEDGGRDHYFARCAKDTETVGTYSQSCGKGCVNQRDENIRTEYR